MRVLVLNGSPHKNGCTARALREVTDVLTSEGMEVEWCHLGAKPQTGCLGCNKCEELHKCVMGDDINEFRDKLHEADALLVGSPVHMAGPAGKLIAFLNRLIYSEYHGEAYNHFAYKPAAAVVSARRGGCTTTFDQINKYFMLMEMPVVSSCYWNAVHGETPEEVEQDEEGLRTMRVLGHNMAYLLKCREAANAAGVPLPMAEPSACTSFIR